MMPEKGEKALEATGSLLDTEKTLALLLELTIHMPHPDFFPPSAGWRRAVRPDHAEEHLLGEGGPGSVHNSGLGHRLPAHQGRGAP